MELHWHVGDVVAKIRELRHLGGGELAALAKVNANTIGRLERHGGGRKSKTLDKVSVALGVSIADMKALIPAPTSLLGSTSTVRQKGAEVPAAVGTNEHQEDSLRIHARERDVPVHSASDGQTRTVWDTPDIKEIAAEMRRATKALEDAARAYEAATGKKMAKAGRQATKTGATRAGHGKRTRKNSGQGTGGT